MTTEEYEQRKQECWEEFCKANPNHNKSIFARKVFDFAFDRAYALGKQEKSVDLKKLNNMLDEALEKETPESLSQWISDKQEKDTEEITIDKEEYEELCKYRRYAANWAHGLTVCSICGEYNPSGCICANCDNNKNWNK